jgi:threonine dehydrogenase-like Zn-dependent dehydrogenase
MRTAVLVEPGRIELVERPPAPLGPAEVRVAVSACGVCASEIPLWTGLERDELPAEIGHEIAGLVAAAGPEVSSLAPGDHVVVWTAAGGGFADELVADERSCVRVAPGLPFPAVAEPLSCVVNAVEMAAPTLGDDIVIVGAGFMGLLTQLVSALKGPRSIVVADVRPDALARAAALGATRVVDTRTESLSAAVEEVTGGRGADVSYEVTGVQAGLDLVTEVTRMSGTLAIVGYHQGAPRSIPLGRWNWMAFHVVNGHFRDHATIMAGMRAGMRLIESGRLDPSALATHTFALDAVAEAFATATARPEGFVKAVVEFSR